MTRRVLVAGGGIGGLEAVLALRALAEERVDITLLSNRTDITYRPLLVTEPFGTSHVADIDVRALAADRGVTFVAGEARSIDTDAHELHTIDRVLRYDDAILALGARAVPSVTGALTFRTRPDAEAVGAAMREVPDGSHLAVVAGAGCAWTLPAYELALLARAWARTARRRLEVSLVTYERDPLEVFGDAVADRMRALLVAHEVRFRGELVPESFAAGRLFVPMTGTLEADFAVALPALYGCGLNGLPVDAFGFVDADRSARVIGADDLYAVGDMTATSVRQGGLAAAQADVAAAAIAVRAGADVDQTPPGAQLRAVLLTPEGPRYLSRPPAGGPDGWDEDPPWWPPHKVASRHLAPYLAAHPELQAS